MLVKLLKYLQGYVRIKVEGYSPERFLNLCNVHKILIWGIDSQNLICEMYVGARDFKKLRPLARKTSTKITLLEKRGVPFFIYRFRKRKIFFLGIVLCTGFVYLLSLFIWNIHLEGNVTQTTEELLSYLETIDVKHGSKKADILCEEIETELRRAYPNILWVSAEMRGTRIIIQIKENTDKDIVSQMEEREDEPVTLVADAPGIIHSMVVRAGTPMISIGDEVLSDQRLVEGYYAIKNDAGEVVRYEPVAADADIVILNLRKYSDSFSVFYKEKFYTGKKRFGIRMQLFHKTVEWIPHISFQFYDENVVVKEIHVTENFYLPFSVELYQYLEYEKKDKKYTEDELKALVEKRFAHKYKNILQKGVQIIEKNVKIDVNDKLCIVGGYVKLQIPVTKTVPVIIPEGTNALSVEGEH
mgnify:FL=1